MPMSDALRELSEWITSTSFDFGGHSGHSGHSVEKSGFSRDHDVLSRGHSGHSTGPVVTAVTASEDALVAAKALKSLDVTSVTAVTAENDKGGNAARFVAKSEPPAQPDEWVLSPYTIRDLACWYEEEGNRRRVGLELDQDSLDRALRRLLAERGVLPEFIAVEFERVMEAVFAVKAPAPAPYEVLGPARLGDGGCVVCGNRSE